MVSDLLNEKYFQPDKLGDFAFMTPGLIDVSMTSHSILKKTYVLRAVKKYSG